RHRAQVRAAHQAGAGRVRPGLGARQAAAAAAGRRRARDGAGHDPRRALAVAREAYVSAMPRITVVDSHTEGEPTRVVLSGWPDAAGDTVLARREAMRQTHDALRRATLLEPRGHDAIVGAVLVPAER